MRHKRQHKYHHKHHHKKQQQYRPHLQQQQQQQQRRRRQQPTTAAKHEARQRDRKSALPAQWTRAAQLSEHEIAALIASTTETLHELNAHDLAFVAGHAAAAGYVSDPQKSEQDMMWECIESTAKSLAPKMDAADASSLIWGLAAARHHSPELMECLTPIFRSQARVLSPGGIAMSLYGYAMLGHKDVPLFHTLGEAAASKLASFTARELAVLMWAHAAADAPNPALFAERDFASAVGRFDILEASDLCRLHQYELWCRERESLARLPPSLASRCAEAFRASNVSPSLFQAEVAHALAGLQLEVSEEVRLESGYTLDLVVDCGGTLVGIEVDGPSHFLGGAIPGAPTGATLLKRRQLRHQGWCVASVPLHDWQAARGQEHEYLNGAITAALGPRLSAYRALGLPASQSAEYSLEDVKQAYHQQLMLNHPDKTFGDPTAEARTKELTAAFRLLYSLQDERAERQASSMARQAQHEAARRRQTAQARAQQAQAEAETQARAQAQVEDRRRRRAAEERERLALERAERQQRRRKEREVAEQAQAAKRAAEQATLERMEELRAAGRPDFAERVSFGLRYARLLLMLTRQVMTSAALRQPNDDFVQMKVKPRLKELAEQVAVLKARELIAEQDLDEAESERWGEWAALNGTWQGTWELPAEHRQTQFHEMSLPLQYRFRCECALVRLVTWALPVLLNSQDIAFGPRLNLIGFRSAPCATHEKRRTDTGASKGQVAYLSQGTVRLAMPPLYHTAKDHRALLTMLLILLGYQRLQAGSKRPEAEHEASEEVSLAVALEHSAEASTDCTE